MLSEADFAVYARLRSLRKSLAENEGLPAYALFTNEQLALMVQRRVASLRGLEEIEGVGAARVKKYGAAFVEVLAGAPPRTADGPPIGGHASETDAH